ncbi:MAG: hypothetical protein HYY34_08035 [Chloroflexi bacterium]|nr:hypothetical protein [Chloroflexota bacterium]
MKITKIETIRVEEFPRVIWVQIYTDKKGVVGLGETWYAATTVQAAIHDHFGPILIGRDPRAVERHWADMFALSDHAGFGGAEMRAISAIDMALWDIKGQDAGLPVYELLGGAVRKKIRVYATGAPYEGCGDLARELRDEGIAAMKMGPTIPLALISDGQFLAPKDLDRALKPIRDVRDAVGMDVQIANDGHGKWNLPCATPGESFIDAWGDSPQRSREMQQEVDEEHARRLQGTVIPKTSAYEATPRKPALRGARKRA